MAPSITPAYYLMMIGVNLSVITAIVMIIPTAYNSYYSRFYPLFSSLSLGDSFLLTLLPAVAALFIAHLYYTRPPTRLVAGLLVAGLSIVSLFGVVGSGISIYDGIFFSGPPVSFTGGMIGAFLSRTQE